MNNYNNQLKWAGYVGILGILFNFLISPILFFSAKPTSLDVFFLSPLSILATIIGLIIFCIHRNGTIALGKKYNNNLLKITGWIYIFPVSVLMGLMGVLFLLSAASALFGGGRSAELSLLSQLLMACSIVVGIFFITLGIAYRKLKGQVTKASLVGNLYIIGGLLLPFTIGAAFILLATYSEIFVFLKESKKQLVSYN
jgi:hypothetical protein